MKDFQVRAAQSHGASIARIFALGFGPRPMLDPETGSGAPAPTPAPEPTPAPAPAPAPTPEPSKKAPTDDEAKLLREVMEKKAKLETAEAAAAAATEALKAFDGVDVEEYRKLKAAQAEADKQAAEKAQDWTKLKDMMAAEHATQVAAKDKDIAEARAAAATAAKEVEDLRVDRAFTTSEYVTNDLTLPPLKARQIYGDRIGVVDGVVVGYDKPAGTDGRQVLVGADGKPLAFDEVVKRMVEADADAEKLKKSKMVPGAGGRTDNAGRRDQNGKIEVKGMARMAAILKSQNK